MRSFTTLELWPGDDETTKRLAAGGLANYTVGLFNGTGDGRLAGTGDFDGDKTAAGRLDLDDGLFPTFADPKRKLLPNPAASSS